MTKQELLRLAARVQEEVMLGVNIIKEKGPKHFARPLGVAAAVLFASYRFVYVPPIEKLRSLDAKLAAARATAQYADKYKTLHDRLLELYAQLPQLKDRDQWLFNSLIDSLKAENIISDSLLPPLEEEVAGLVYQNVTMSSSLKYSEVLSWIARIESAKPALHFSVLDIEKKPEVLGQNKVVCTLSTIIPKKRFIE